MTVIQTRAWAFVGLCSLLVACEQDTESSPEPRSDASLFEDMGGQEDTAEPAPISFCDGATRQRYAPAEDEELALWPDHAWTVDNPDRPTGFHIDVTPSKWYEAVSGPVSYTHLRAHET